NTIVIMTSNIGARLITEKKQAFGFNAGENDAEQDYNTIKELVVAELKKAFRPEFLNRIDDTIVFKKLSKDDIKTIARKKLSIREGKLENLGIKITFDTSVIEQVAENGFDATYGARPLRREIQNSIEDLISERILDGTFKSGDTVKCSFKNGEYSFEK
ncbi:MAG: ATP-dependent Clp protease ATP-binding subunit, partial [Clostridia bacterium]|nr:ATP-dependent Clp protease ATP-binding subunit [Clostridia bacterium]